MHKRLIFILLVFLTIAGQAQVNTKYGGYPITPVPFTSVKVSDHFWGQRLEANRKVTIPLAFKKCEETGRYENFVKAAHPKDSYKAGGFPFDDTDVYKTIEGASYSLQTYPNNKMVHYIDSVLAIVAAAQEPDGYLYTPRTMNPKNPHDWSGSTRWSKEEDGSHELYNLGHMLEGAIAYYQATGKKNFLNIAIKYADCVCRQVGDKSGQAKVVPGHQIAEMALCKLYVLTGNKKYLDEAKFFLDERGRTTIKNPYSQSQKPIIEQDEAVGHAVRAGYMYSGIADVAALTGDKSYIDAIDRIWENVVSKKIYITGGIGARHEGEAFGDNYELPNKTAYNETCAAIANVYWNYRMFLLHGDAKYYDVLERTLYNGLISGVSLDGGKFFYPNPLEADGKYQFNADGTCDRQPWFGCACCPSNLSRFIPSIPGYTYAVKDKDLYINLFLSNTSKVKVGGKDVVLKQTTNYPWGGKVTFNVEKVGTPNFNLLIRIPGWLRGQVLPSDLYSYADNQNLSYSVKVNGKTVTGTLEKGYFSINRKWKKDDQIEVVFDMKPRIVKANSKVEADRGRICIERGPIVYCAEFPDNDFNIRSMIVNQNPKMEVVERKDLLYGINQIKADAQTLSFDGSGRLVTKDVKLTLIPYYAWNHRGLGNMMVWLPIQLNAVDM